MQFDSHSVISRGFKLDGNFLVEHLTKGAFHPQLGTIIPASAKPLDIIKTIHDFPLREWQVAANLHNTTTKMLTPLIKEFGSDLIVSRGFDFTNNLITSHTSGEALDIAIKGFEDNMFPMVNKIKSVIGSGDLAESILNFGGSSWIHLGMKGPYTQLLGSLKEFTIDHRSLQRLSGLIPMRGDIGGKGLF